MKKVALLIDTHINNKEFSPLSIIGGISVIKRSIVTLKQALFDEIILVTDNEDLDIEKEVSHLGVTLLRSSQNSTISKVKEGLKYLENQNFKILILPANISLFTLNTLYALLKHNESFVVPVYNNNLGYPVLLSTKQADLLKNYTRENDSLDEIIKNLGAHTLFNTDDSGVIVRSKNSPYFKDALKQYNLQLMRPEIKLRICKEKPFFGPGTSQLLSLISSTGSVRKACELMGISYSKGWNMINLIEEQLEKSVVERQQGGKKGGSAHLTAFGQEFLSAFLAYQEECIKEMSELFNKHFEIFL